MVHWPTWNLPSNVNNKPDKQIITVCQAFNHEKLIGYENRMGFFQDYNSCGKSILFYSYFSDWHDSSKEIHSEVFSKSQEKSEDGKSLSSEDHLLSEYSPPAWKKCLNIPLKAKFFHSSSELEVSLQISEQWDCKATQFPK